MLTRTPSPAKGRTEIPTSPHAAAKSSARSPSGNQTKLPCASGSSQPTSRSRATRSARRSTSSETRSNSSSRASSDAIAAAWATWLTPKGSDTARSAPASGAGATAYPTRKPARP